MQDFSAKDNELEKLFFQGVVASVQPRIRLLRSFDQRNHSYLGYVLRVNGIIRDTQLEFLVGIGKGAQSKHMFRVDDVVSGQCQPVKDQRMETVEYYKVSNLKLLQRPQETEKKAPPWVGVPPDLETYRQRGHRRLDVNTCAASARSGTVRCVT